MIDPEADGRAGRGGHVDRAAEPRPADADGDLTLRTRAGRRLAAYLALPDRRPGTRPGVDTGADDRPGAAGLRGPAVLVVHELLGLNDDIRRIARTFAGHGYVALAPDLVGEGPRPLCLARFLHGIGRVGTGRPYRELAAFQDWLAARPDVDPDRVGLAGFCAGGGFAILYTARGGRRVRAVAPFYAALPRDDSVLRDLCPTVASYGARDRVFGHLGPRLEAALDAARIPHDVRTYPDAGHSFLNRHDGLAAALGPRLPMHVAFDERAAADAWSRVLAFFDRHLAPDPA